MGGACLRSSPSPPTRTVASDASLESELQASLSSAGEMNSTICRCLIDSGAAGFAALAGARTRQPLAAKGKSIHVSSAAEDALNTSMVSRLDMALSDPFDRSKIPAHGKVLEAFLGTDTVTPDTVLHVVP